MQATRADQGTDAWVVDAMAELSQYGVAKVSEAQPSQPFNMKTLSNGTPRDWSDPNAAAPLGQGQGMLSNVTEPDFKAFQEKSSQEQGNVLHLSPEAYVR